MSSFEDSDEKLDKAMASLENWYDSAINEGKGFKNDKEREEYVKSLGDPEKHPMFAQTTEDLEGNPLAEAFRALREEDKSLCELAIMYKEEGNEWMKKSDKKSLKEAHDRYTYALAFLIKADKARQDGSEDPKDKEVDINLLRSQIYSNRAQTCIKQTNYGSCIKDCNISIEANPQNIKSHYRKSRALFLLKRYEDCIESSNSGLVAMEKASISDIKTKDSFNDLIDSSKKFLEKIKSNYTFSLKNQFNESLQLYRDAWRLSQTNSISFGRFSLINPEPQQLLELWPSIKKEHEITWPILLLYPQYNRFDVIEAANSNDMIVEHLAAIFPEKESNNDFDPAVSWDAYDEYHISNLEIYIELQSNKTIQSENEWIQSCIEHHILCKNGDINLLLLADSNQKEVIMDSHEKIKTRNLLKKSVEEKEKKFLKETEENIKQAGQAKYSNIHLGCTIQQIASATGHVLPRGHIALIIFPKTSPSHLKFKNEVQKEGYTINSVNPV